MICSTSSTFVATVEERQIRKKTASTNSRNASVGIARRNAWRDNQVWSRTQRKELCPFYFFLLNGIPSFAGLIACEAQPLPLLEIEQQAVSLRRRHPKQGELQSLQQHQHQSRMGWREDRRRRQVHRRQAVHDRRGRIVRLRRDR